MQHAKQRSIALIRLLHALHVRKKPKRAIPKQRQPDAIRLEYFKAIRFICDDAHKILHHYKNEILHLLLLLRLQQGKQDSRFDADESKTRQALAVVEKASKAVADAFKPHDLFIVARQFGKRTAAFQKEQLDKQVQAAIGVPFSAIEKPVKDRLNEYATKNVELIKTVNGRYIDRIRTDVEKAFTTGTHPETLAQDFEDRYDMSLDDARRIARDQIGKLNAQVNQDRQESLGVTSYIWRTMNDERVRDEHAPREGEQFDWDDPPEGGHPGEDIMCRCYSEPIFDELLQTPNEENNSEDE